jgi:hypothetical protein
MTADDGSTLILTGTSKAITGGVLTAVDTPDGHTAVRRLFALTEPNNSDAPYDGLGQCVTMIRRNGVERYQMGTHLYRFVGDHSGCLITWGG